MLAYNGSFSKTKFSKLSNNKNLRKTLFVTFICCIITIVIIWCVQTYGQSKAGEGCSYLDPPLIDYLAFSAAIFLIIEGFWKILQHPNALLKNQYSRIMRIMLGCSITTIHILQFIHK